LASLISTISLVNVNEYLYPLIIEFSLIGAVSFYNIYENIGLMERIRKKRRMRRATPFVSSTVLHFPHHKAVNVTCHKSFKGTLLGVIMVALTVISCVLYNVHQSANDVQAMIVSGAVFNFTDIGLLFLGILAVCIALHKIGILSVLPKYNKGPDEILLIIAVVGLYAYECYATYSYISISQLQVWMRIAGAVSGCLSIIQSTLQVLFVYDGLRRQTTTTKLLRRKPGREAVVFLLLLNLALWMLYSFEIQGGIYQVVASIDPTKSNEWIFATTLCKPLAIYFRFHSTTCLYQIWKKSYKLEKSEDD
jgi:hypothetical protein